jgi:hypothetical protein
MFLWGGSGDDSCGDEQGEMPGVVSKDENHARGDRFQS